MKGNGHRMLWREMDVGCYGVITTQVNFCFSNQDEPYNVRYLDASSSSLKDDVLLRCLSVSTRLAL